MFPLSSWDSWENFVKYSVLSKGKCENGFLLTFRRCQIPITWPDPAVQPSCCSARTHSSPAGVRAAAWLPGFVGCWERGALTLPRAEWGRGWREHQFPAQSRCEGLGAGGRRHWVPLLTKDCQQVMGQSSTATEAEFRRHGGGFFFLQRYKPQTECG